MEDLEGQNQNPPEPRLQNPRIRSCKTCFKISWRICSTIVNLINIIGGVYLSLYWPVYASFIVIFNALLLLIHLYSWCFSNHGLFYYLLLGFLIGGSAIQCMVMLGLTPVWPDDTITFMNSNLMTTDIIIFDYLSFFYFYSCLLVAFSCFCVVMMSCCCCCLMFCGTVLPNDTDSPASPEDLTTTMITTFGELYKDFTGLDAPRVSTANQQPDLPPNPPNLSDQSTDLPNLSNQSTDPPNPLSIPNHLPPDSNILDADSGFIENSPERVIGLSEPSESAHESSEACGICATPYEKEDVIRKLQCNHYYHKDCIDEWFKRSKLCPICKQSIIDSKDLHKVSS